jgi:CHAT domain-containing protein
MCSPVIPLAVVFTVFLAVWRVLFTHCSAELTTIADRAIVSSADRIRKTATEIADRLKANINAMQLTAKTKQSLIHLILLCFAFISQVSAQPSDILKQIGQAQIEFDNGSYAKAIELAEAGIEKARKNKNGSVVLKGLDVIASSQISLQDYSAAEKSLGEALQILSENEKFEKSRVYLRYAWLRRSERKFQEALEFCQKALDLTPENQQIQGEYYLNIGRILFASGYDISAIIWLEKAEKSFETAKTSSAKLETYRFLSLAWASKLNYPAALKYAGKLITAAENTQFKHKYRQALFESATSFDATGQKQKAVTALKKGLKSSIEQNHSYQICNFLSTLLLRSLDNNELTGARGYLEQLEKYDAKNRFLFERTLGRAIISAFQNQKEISENLFVQLDKMEKYSEFILPRWRIKIAERNKDWEQVIRYNEKVLDLTLKSNFRDDLPAVYLDFAKAYFNLNQTEKSQEYLEKTLALVEEIRQSEDNNLSLGLSETYHDAYRLLTQIKSGNPQNSFELAEFMKARILKDKIDNSALKELPTISIETRQRLEELSLKFINDPGLADEVEKNEKLITTKIPVFALNKPDLSDLDKIPDLSDAAVISYFFTLDKKLLAFVWERGQGVKAIYLPVSEDEVNVLAKTITQKIKNFIFFKRDGREIYDKFLKPLNLESKHLIIIPDKSLWKIPFQALSADGEKYLIEEKTVSYAPSGSILLEQLKEPKPNRQTLQAFANSSYDDRILQYVNAEASSVAGIYGSKPVLNATVADFARFSDKTDILHFSMHAQVDSEQPLNSFLGFKKVGKDDGRLTAEELLNVKLKKGSLAFLASCDTNNVLNGEGLVSLAWAMMGSGATTVVSAQWEADDKSTEIFTEVFYTHYKQGNSSAEALQKASLELIKNKFNNMHEPYYWANFSLYGDSR